MFEFNIKKLIKKTSSFIKSKDNSSIQSKLLLSFFDWRRVCYLYFGFYSIFFSRIIGEMWKKDLLGYRSSVVQKLSRNSSILVEKKMNFSIKITENEWNRLQKGISGESDKRKRFRSVFTCFINKKILSKGINCVFVCISNWFAKENSRKKTSNFWNGKYKCKHCNKIAKLSIAKECFTNIILKVKTNGGYEHEYFSFCQRIVGKKRDKLTQNIFEKGHILAQAETFLEEKLGKKNNSGFINPNTFHKMKSERVNADKISTIHEFDSKAIKNGYDELFENKFPKGIKGFVQSIRSDPFGLLLTSSIQLNIWSMIQEDAPILFFDATGSILKDIPGQSKILLFSLVAHDKKKKLIVPIGEFFTTSLTSRTISNFLSEFKDLMAMNLHSRVLNKFPRIIVLDFTWANINAVLEAFNKVTIFQYIQWTEELICKGNFKVNHLMNVKVFLCSTHFLKIIINKVKKTTPSIDISISKDFIVCFSLLQNSKILKQFEDLLVDLLYIYSSKFLNEEIIERLNRVKQKIRDRDVDLKNEPLKEFNNEKIEIVSYFTNDHVESLIKNSPFTKYFETLLFIHKEKIKNIKDNGLTNHYYFPKLFKIIEDKLYILPLWTGILLNLDSIPYLDVLDTRISNNSVENYFNNLRNCILRISKRQKMVRRLMPSQYVSRLVKFLSFIYYKNYDAEYAKKFFGKPLLNNNDQFDEEKWAFEKSHFLREKGFYYNTKKVFNDFDNMNNLTDFKINRSNTNKLGRFEFFKIFLPENGGFCQNFEIINTCSIDYFLLVISYIFFYNQNIENLKKNDKNDLIQILFEISEKIRNYRMDEARFIWVKKIGLVPSDQNQFNCMLSIYDAFYSDYSQIQTFSWYEKCQNKDCKKNRNKYHSSHLFKLSKKKKSQKLELVSDFVRNGKAKCESINKLYGKCNSSKEFSNLKFTICDPPLIIAINCFDQAKIENIPFEISIKEKKYALFGFNLHKINHFVFYLFENNKFFKLDNLKNDQILETKNEKDWKITHVFYEII